MNQLTEQEINMIMIDGGFRNAAGGIYATSVLAFARAIQKELESRTPEPGQREAGQSCTKCRGRKGEWEAGAPAHPTNWYPCEHCKETGVEPPSQPEQGDSIFTDDYLRELWRSHGGDFHGPHIETGTMPESKLLPFLRNLCAIASKEQGEAEPVAALYTSANNLKAIADGITDRIAAYGCRTLGYEVPLYTRPAPRAAVPDLLPIIMRYCASTMCMDDCRNMQREILAQFGLEL